MFKVEHFENTKNVVLALLASAVLAVGLAVGFGPSASAEGHINPNVSVDCNGVGNCDTEDNRVDRSRTYTVSGDCSAIFEKISQSQYNETDQKNKAKTESENENGLNLLNRQQSGDATTNQSNSNSTAQSQTGVNFSPDCSVTQVTNQAAAATAAQVQAPRGAVSAGAGGAVESSNASVIGLVGSALTMGAGLVLRRQFEL